MLLSLENIDIHDVLPRCPCKGKGHVGGRPNLGHLCTCCKGRHCEARNAPAVFIMTETGQFWLSGKDSSTAPFRLVSHDFFD